MTYLEATEAIKRLPLIPVRPAAFPAPQPTRAKQAGAWLTCRENAKGKRSCGHVR